MKKIVPAIVTISLFTLTACSGTQNDTAIEIEQTAQLDYTNNLIILPLNEYTLTESDISIFTQANNLLTQTCLREQGFQTTPLSEPVQLGSRDYGMWNPGWTQQYGYGLALETQESELSSEEQKASLECADNNSNKYFNNLTQEFDLPLSLAREARAEAEQHPAWKEAKDRWGRCLSDRGLSFSSPERWASDQGSQLIEQGNFQSPDNTSEMIRVATIEAECSQQEGVAQELANIEGTFQKKLIEENSATLNEVKLQKQETLEQARLVIAETQ